MSRSLLWVYRSAPCAVSRYLWECPAPYWCGLVREQACLWGPQVSIRGLVGSPVSWSVGPDRRQGCRARVYVFCRGSSAQLKSQVRS